MTIRLYFVTTVNGLMKTSKPYQKWAPKDSYELYLKNLAKADVCIVGSSTYAVMKDKEFISGVDYIVFTHNPSKHKSRSSVSFYSGDVSVLIDELKTKNVKNIAVLGGAQVAGTFLNADLIDELIIDIAPSIDGKGKNFLPDSTSSKRLHLKTSKILSSGTMQLTYAVKAN